MSDFVSITKNNNDIISTFTHNPNPSDGDIGIEGVVALLADIATSVKKFGAKGDGVTDDSQAILNAINSLGTIGGVVYFPSGTYVTGQIKVPPRVKLQGAGELVTTIQLKIGSNTDLIVLDQAQAAGITDLTLDGNKWNNHNTAGNGMVIKNSQNANLDNSRNLKIEQMNIQNFPENGIKILAPNVWIFQLRFIKIDQCNAYGIWNNATDNTYYAIDIFGCTNGAVYDAGSNNHFIGGKWYGNGGGNRTNSTLLSSAHRTTYSDIEMQDNYGHGVTLNGAIDVTLSAVTSDSCGVNNDSVDGHIPAESSYRIIGSSRRIKLTGCIASCYDYQTAGKQAYGLTIDGTCSDISYDINFAEEQVTTLRNIDTSAGVVDMGSKKPQQAFNTLGVPTNIVRPTLSNIPLAFSAGVTMTGLQMYYSGGSSAVLDFINSSPANLFAGSNEWTLEFEIEIMQKQTASGSAQVFYMDDGTNNIKLTSGYDGTNLSLYLENTIGGTYSEITSPTYFVTGTKYYISIVKNPDSIYYYVNGVLMGSKTVTGSLNTSALTALRLRTGNGMNYLLRNLKFSKVARSIYELNQNWTIDESTTVLMPLQSDLSVGHGLAYKIQTGASLPTAGVAYRNVLYTVQGNGTSTSDIIYICLISSTGAYSWKQIISG